MVQKWGFSGVFQARTGNLLPHPLPHIADRHPNWQPFAGQKISQNLSHLAGYCQSAPGSEGTPILAYAGQSGSAHPFTVRNLEAGRLC